MVKPYGTRPWKIYGEGPTEVVGGAFGDSKMKPFTAQDIRFTTKGDTLYAISLDIPSTVITIKSLSGKAVNRIIAGVEVLGSSEKVVWSQKPNGLVIQPSKQYPSENAVAYRILFVK